MGEVRVFLVRHGKTALNSTVATSQDRVGAWTDHPLTAEGRQEAVRAARQLAGQPLTLVASSDLKRGEQTASVIARATGAPRRSSPAFRSWNLGELAGKPFDEAAPVIRKYAGECPARPAPEGESFDSFKARALPAVQRLLAQAKRSGKPLALVTHVRVLKLIEGWIAAGCQKDKIDLNTFMKTNAAPGTVLELTPTGTRWAMTVLDAGEKAVSG
jgi:broad specificity phosphatase PhoE